MQHNYDLLEGYLRNLPSSTKQVVLTFDQIEKIIAPYKLPPSAKHPELHYFRWWDNRPHDAGNKYWLDAGWKTTMIDIENQRVKFQRIQGV